MCAFLLTQGKHEVNSKLEHTQSFFRWAWNWEWWIGQHVKIGLMKARKSVHWATATARVWFIDGSEMNFFLNFRSKVQQPLVSNVLTSNGIEIEEFCASRGKHATRSETSIFRLFGLKTDQTTMLQGQTRKSKMLYANIYPFIVERFSLANVSSM